MCQLSAIIVNFNTRELTLSCLGKLVDAIAGMDAEIWIVDNASTDNSVEAFRAQFPQVNVIESPTNVGFGAANNLAMRRARGEFFLLINSDAYPIEDAVQKMIAFLLANPDVGMVGPTLRHGDGTFQESRLCFPTPKLTWINTLRLGSILQRKSARNASTADRCASHQPVEALDGACILVRREVFQQTRGFDERYFMYYEEVDWQRAVRKQNWKIVYLQAAEVTHLRWSSAAKLSVPVEIFQGDSLDYYMWKHYGKWGFASARIAGIMGCSLRLCTLGLMAALPRRRGFAISRFNTYAAMLRRCLTHWDLRKRA